MEPTDLKTMQKQAYKYQKLIDELAAQGCQMPELHLPANMAACRFASSVEGAKNHIPQYVSKPKRMLADVAGGRANMSLLALSCFTTDEKAVTFYGCLRKSFKNIAVTVGDSLAEGTLTDTDGEVTTPAANGHFDLYEYEGCDLNRSFLITKQLI